VEKIVALLRHEAGSVRSAANPLDFVPLDERAAQGRKPAAIMVIGRTRPHGAASQKYPEGKGKAKPFGLPNQLILLALGFGPRNRAENAQEVRSRGRVVGPIPAIG